MEKANFNITYAKKNRGGKQEHAAIPGYIFMYSGIRFGVSKYYLFNDKPEPGFTWTITELTSGFSVGVRETTAKAAIEKMIEMRIVPRVREILEKTYTGDDVNPGLIPKTEYLSVHA